MWTKPGGGLRNKTKLYEFHFPNY